MIVLRARLVLEGVLRSATPRAGQRALWAQGGVILLGKWPILAIFGPPGVGGVARQRACYYEFFFEIFCAASGMGETQLHADHV